MSANISPLFLYSSAAFFNSSLGAGGVNKTSSSFFKSSSLNLNLIASSTKFFKSSGFVVGLISSSSPFFLVPIINWLNEITNATANGSNTTTINIMKNLTTDFNSTLNASATNLKPPTSLSIPILAFLISLMCPLYATIESCNELILVDILADCLSRLSAERIKRLLTLPLVINVLCVLDKSFCCPCNVNIWSLVNLILLFQTSISLCTCSSFRFCC